MGCFGWLTDKHPGCPPGAAVVVNLNNQLCVPEACGRVELLDAEPTDAAWSRLFDEGLHTGYRLRKRRWAMGGELAEPDTRVEPFVVRENSLLASTPEAPIHTLLAGPNRVYEGDDGELYFEDPVGAGFTTWTTGCWRSFARPAHEPSGLLKNRMRDALFEIDQLFQKYRLGRLRLRPAHQSTAAILAESQAARWRQIVEPYRAPAIRTPIAQRRTVSRAYAEARQAPRPAIIRHALRQAARAVL